MDFNTLKKALIVLGVILLAMITFYSTLMIGGLVVGTISQTATGGSINVSTAMNTALTGVEAVYITQSDSLAGNVPVVVGLIAIVVIILIFFGKKFNLSGGNGGSSGMN